MSSTFRNTMIGSCLVALAQLIFVTTSAIVKLSVLKESQILFFRFGIQFIIATFWWIFKKPENCKNWYGGQTSILNIWLRGITFATFMVIYYYAIIRLPLGDMECIYLQSPLVIAIMAWVFLKEKLPKLTPIICILGVIGIVCISQPPFLTVLTDKLFNKLFNLQHENEKDHSIREKGQAEPLNTDGLISLFIAILLYCISTVLVRNAKEAHWLQLEIVSSGLAISITIPLLMILNEFVLHNKFIGNFNNITDTWSFDIESIIILTVIGTFGFIALSLITIGYQYGDATKVAWLEYITIVFSLLYQTFVFGDIPNKFEIVGAILVTMACLLTLLEELYYYYANKCGHEISYDELQNIDTSDAFYDYDTETE